MSSIWQVIPWFDEGYPDYPDERGVAEWVSAVDAGGARKIVIELEKIGKLDMGRWAWLEVVLSDATVFEKQLALERAVWGREKSTLRLAEEA